MALVKGAWVELLKPGLAREFFYGWYHRREGQSRHTFRNARRRAFKKWVANLPPPEEFNDEPTRFHNQYL